MTTRLFKVYALSTARPTPIVFFVAGVSKEDIVETVARRLGKITRGQAVFNVQVEQARDEEERVRDVVREALERAAHDSRGR